MRKLLMMSVLLLAVPALAQDDAPAPQQGGGKGGGSKTTTIDFEDDTIEGDLSKPDGEYVEARKKVQHSNLIRIREDFEDKVMQSVGEL
jgi:hypothetical protein